MSTTPGSTQRYANMSSNDLVREANQVWNKIQDDSEIKNKPYFNDLEGCFHALIQRVEGGSTGGSSV